METTWNDVVMQNNNNNNTNNTKEKKNSSNNGGKLSLASLMPAEFQSILSKAKHKIHPKLSTSTSHFSIFFVVVLIYATSIYIFYCCNLQFNFILYTSTFQQNTILYPFQFVYHMTLISTN